jgi:hypothetical protein
LSELRLNILVGCVLKDISHGEKYSILPNHIYSAINFTNFPVAKHKKV